MKLICGTDKCSIYDWVVFYIFMCKITGIFCYKGSVMLHICFRSNKRQLWIQSTDIHHII
jgi:hypothetical protein